MKKLSRVFGISPVDAAQLEAHGVHTILDLAQHDSLPRLSSEMHVPTDQLRRWQQVAQREASWSRFRTRAVVIGTLVTVLGGAGLALRAPRPEKNTATQSYNDAWALYDGGDTAGAIRLLDSVLQRGEASADIYNLRGALYRDAGQLTAAIGSYHKSLALDSTYGYAWYNLGNVLLAQHDTAKAAESYERAVAAMPHEAAYHRALAALRMGQGRTADAISEYQAAITAAPGDIESYQTLSNIYVGLQRPDDARRILYQATTHNPSSAAAFAALGAFHAAQDSSAAAASAYAIATRLDPTQVDYWRRSAQAFRATREWDRARHAYREVIRLDAKDWDAHFYIGWILAQQGEGARAAAIAAYDSTLRAIPDDPRNKWTYLNLAIEYAVDTGDAALARADTALKRAIALDARFTQAFLQSAYIQQARGRLGPAKRMYQRAIDIDPGYASAYDGLHSLYLLEANYDSALAVRRRLLSRAPSSKQARWLLARDLEGKEKYREAVIAYRAIVADYPDDQDAIVRLATAELDAGHHLGDTAFIVSALKTLEDAIARDSTASGAYFQLAWAYQTVPQIRDLDKAQRYYEKSLANNPRNLVALNNLASVALEREDFAGMASSARKILAMSPRNLDGFSNLGYAEFLQGNLQAALMWYDSAKVVAPADASLRTLRAETYLWLGAPGEAHGEVTAARTAVTHPGSNDAQFIWTRLLQTRYGGSRRIVYYAGQPRKLACLDLLDATTYLSENDIPQAVRVLERGALRLRSKPEDQEVLHMGAADLVRLRQQIPALDAVDAALAYLYARLGDSTLAADHARRYLTAGQDSTALRLARQAIEADQSRRR